MQIGGSGPKEAAKWGETPEIQRTAQKTAEKAMTDAFVSQIQEMAKKDAEKGLYMSKEFVQYRSSYMKRTVSPNPSRPVAQAMSLLQKSVNQYGTFLQKLLGGYSMEVHIGTHPTVELFAPNGEMIAAQTSGGQWIELHTEAEEKFMGESTMVYLKAYRAARAEIKAAAQAPVQSAAGTVDPADIARHTS